MPPEEQELLMAGLRAEGIPFRTGEGGEIWYAVSDKSRIGAVQQRVVERTRPLRSVGFDSAEEAELFARLLGEGNVQARRWVDLGKHWVAWKAPEETAAQQALAAFTRAMAERARTR